MTKELEVVRKLQHCGVEEYRMALENVEKILLEYEKIKNSNPSEALDGFRGFKNGMITNNAICITKSYFDDKFPVIESALLKAQEQDKENAEYKRVLKIIFEKKVDTFYLRQCFKVKDGLQDKFEKLFNEKFGEYFSLYKVQDVIDSKLFGDGDENVLFRDALGDFIAINETNNKCLTYSNWTHFKSNHAGYMDDEILVPLIIIDKCK
jgi:L-rhamnose mutarotase